MAVSSLATKYMFENFGAVRWNSRNGAKITTIVVHHVAGTNFDSMPRCWANVEASAHYGVGQNGEIRAYIDEDKRAWHANNANDYSIGIECTNISGAPDWKISEATITALVKLIQEIQSRYGQLAIIGHKDAPGAATACPGPYLYSRLQEIRNRVNSNPTITVTPDTNKTQNQEDDEIMVCIFQVNGENTQYYFDGKNITKLGHEHEREILERIYKLNTGKNMPVLAESKAWFNRLKAVAQRKVM